MFRGFTKFVMRGNVVDLAVGVVIGGAFGAVVTALVKDLITPIVAAFVGKPDFGALAFTINGSRFAYGDFIDALISFVLIATSVYFIVVVPMNALTTRFAPQPSTIPAMRECPECLSEVPAAARRCKFCTAIVATGER